ncbi:MAG TPA: LLM class F420-dependent oxidoreductase [Acidimicrobiales bacterium]|nr:LLM class F420-dependent oxidoreductase [Acidimicrobiales bacterium]
MQLSSQLSYAGGFAEAADQLADLEKAGLDVAWVAEAYGFDAVSLMGYIAAKTERIKIGSSILNIYSRTPALLAQTAAGVDALSNGRALLGIGASGPQVVEGFHGIKYDKPVQRTREIIEICRQVWRRERLEHDGLYTLPLPPDQGTGLGKPLKMLTHPVRPTIPIYVAALGPKNVELTAEVADGWLPILYVPEKAASVWGDALAAGKAKRADDLPPLDIVAGGMAAIGDGLEGLRDLARPFVALYVGGMGARGQNFYNKLACRYGFEKEAALIQDLYLDGKKDEAAKAVPVELLESMTLVGPAGYVKERIDAFRESGVTTLNVTPMGPTATNTIEQIRSFID